MADLLEILVRGLVASLIRWTLTSPNRKLLLRRLLVADYLELVVEESLLEVWEVCLVKRQMANQSLWTQG